MTQRTLFIGDVHGCIKELNLLLKKVNAQTEDRIIFIGDLIRKGPESRRVWERYKELNAEIVLGNQEWSVREQMAKRCPKRPSLKQVKEDFGEAFEDFVEDLDHWPALIEEKDFIAVHAGLRPDLRWEKTSEDDLTNMRTWDGKGKDLQDPDNDPWFEFYTKKKLVVFGHWAALGGVDRANVVGLDTGCVYGGRLTALIWPERKLVSVPASKIYCPI